MKKKILILLIVLLNFLFINFADVKAGELTCLERTTKESCLDNNHGYACVWNETKYGNYCNVDNLMYISCGDATDIPYQAPGLISFAVNLLKIATPIILIVISVISLLKALASSNEDEIKKSQKSLIRKLIAAAMVFFIISIVQFVIMKVSDDSETTNISDCLSCFLNNDCEENIYYKTNIASTYYCTPLSTGIKDECETFNINNKSSYVVDNEFYQGPKVESCSGEYDSKGRPTAIMFEGECRTLTTISLDEISWAIDGNEHVFVEENLSGDMKRIEDVDIKNIGISAGEFGTFNYYFYWSPSKNDYVEFLRHEEVKTPYYHGEKAESCDGTYFEGYRPAAMWPWRPSDQLLVGGCTKLEIDTNKIYIQNGKKYKVYKFKTDDELFSSDQYRYYWSEEDNEYKYLDTVNNIYTKYYQGPKISASCDGHGYWGHQPKAIRDKGICYKLESTGVKHTFEIIDLFGKGSIVNHTIWKANGKCYYWVPTKSAYESISCP